ncbi:FAD-linked oxidase C-terminal domain-containing protein [Anaerolineales bacterium HSG25]|nr:FAD-linked oxidase C-terminal domain-containing protein [Anaerolineales bacterium HSG25]
MTHTQKIQDFMAELGRQVQGTVQTDTYSKILYSTDASIYQVMPHGVLIPKSTEDVQAAVELAVKHQVPILARTAGSSLAGQAVNEALVIDFTRHLNQVLEVNEEEQWVRLQPGLVLDELNLHLRPYNLQFGPDPASSNRAALGGIVSNNSTGSHSILYGMTADHVLETGVLLSDGSSTRFKPLDHAELTQRLKLDGLEGELYRRVHDMSQQKADVIRQGTPQHWRRCGGYNLDRFVQGGISYQWPADERFNLSRLICGSEGTLAVMTDITLNLVPRPKMAALAIVQFDELRHALAATPAILEIGPSAIELLDNFGLTLCREVPKYARLLDTFMEGQPHCVLLTEFYGDSEAELKGKIEQLQTHLKQQSVGATGIIPIFAPDLQANVWTVRKVGLGLLMSMRGDYKPLPFIEDSAVPVEQLAEYVTRIEKFCNDLGTDVAYYAHASGGCIHIRPLINAKVASEIDKLPQICEFAVELLGQYGGSWSSEHGDGRARSWLNEQFFGSELYGLYKEVKQTFDPQNLFNPGNIVEGGPMTENLRYGGDYQTIDLTEHLDFSTDEGFHRAVEMCNGAGVCRKRSTGTMCPSFMATQDEKHSTRGRANLLRSALSGQLPPEELTGKEMYEAMDLCLQCKACKAECPSSVDMAKIKFEFQAHYHNQHGIPLRSRLFSDINFWSHLGSGAPAPLANWINNNSLVKLGLEKVLGISSQRSLPQFTSMPFTRWFKYQHEAPADRHQRKKVVLFTDTFHNFNYPHVAIAATEVLEAAGFEVLLSGHGCCGRPAMSKGLVNQARLYAKQTVKRLKTFADQYIPIIGLEPSCLLSIRDEYLALLPDQKEEVEWVGRWCYTFEEYIAKLADEGELNLEFTDDSRPVLLHGHCHQKALVGTKPSVQVLALPGHTVSEADSGCCGMAGSFGYEAEHYDTSMQIGEQRLFPAVREQQAGTIIAAAGVSCRQQIKQGTGRHALHPAEILRNGLMGERKGHRI